MKKDYNAIREDIIRQYDAIRSVQKVARELHIAPSAVSKIVREAGYVTRASAPKKSKPKYPPDSCAYCRSCSRLSSWEGYCLKHRRSVKLRRQEPCFN